MDWQDAYARLQPRGAKPDRTKSEEWQGRHALSFVS